MTNCITDTNTTGYHISECLYSKARKSINTATEYVEDTTTSIFKVCPIEGNTQAAASKLNNAILQC